MNLALDYAHGDDIAANISREPIDNDWFAQYVNSAVYTSLQDET